MGCTQTLKGIAACLDQETFKRQDTVDYRVKMSTSLCFPYSPHDLKRDVTVESTMSGAGD